MKKRPRTNYLPLWLFALAAVLLMAKPAQAGVRYFMLIFGAQTHPKIPRFTHTFCTIVRVVDGPPECLHPIIEAYTISWLPRTMIIHPLRLHAEPGHNFTLHETLRWANQNRMDVSLWGPYLIEEDFFGKVYREYERFERGEYLYRAIDSRRRDDLKADCIHAVTDIDQRDRRRTFRLLGSGEADASKFACTLKERGRVFESPEDLSWLNAALGLDCYPICSRPTPPSQSCRR